MTERRHRLLTRQLQRHLVTVEDLAPGTAALIADVSRAYEQADADRTLLERSLELTSRELLERNEELSAAMRQAAISIWSWDPSASEFSIQGYGPVGFEDVRGRVSFPVDALLARISTAERGTVAELLTGPAVDREIDLQFRVRSGDGMRWVRMRGNRDRGGERCIGVWADVTAEAEIGRADRRRGEVMSRQTYTLQRLAEELVVGTDLATVLARTCADAGATLDVAWISVWLLEDDGRTLRCAARCAYPSGAPTSGDVMAIADHPVYVQALSCHRTIAATSVAHDPTLVELVRSCTARNVSSLLASACRGGGRLIGLVCAEHVGSPRTWTLEERAFAASVADGVSLAIEGQRRQRAEAERATLEESLRQAQKLEALGLLAGGVAHDFNNLLTPILACSEMVRDGSVTGDDYTESVEAICSAALAARDLVAQLLAFGRRQVLQLRQIDLNDVCERTAKLLNRSLPETITIELTRCPGLGGVCADPGSSSRSCSTSRSTRATRCRRAAACAS